jgi:hypothetical protein
MKTFILLLTLSIPLLAQTYNPLIKRKLDSNTIGTMGAYGTPQNGYGPIWNAANGRPEWGALPGAAGGEANTGSSLGTGVAIFKSKVGVDLQFKTVQSANNRLTVAANADGNHVDLTIVEANFVLTTSQVTGLDAAIADAITTGSNVGAGVAVYKDESTTTLRFKTLQSANNRLTVAANGDGNHVDLTIVEANFVLATSQITGLDTALANKAPLADGAANVAFASLPSANLVSGRKYLVTDAPTKTECGAGGGDGTTPALCYSNGVVYIALGEGTGGGTPGGSSGQLQINSGGSFAGRNLPGFTDDGTNLNPDGSLLAEVSGDNVYTGLQDSSGATRTSPDKNAAADPATCTKGDTYWNTSTLTHRRCTATNTWANNGSAGTTSPLTTKGDIYTYSTTNDRLPIGTDGQSLQADSSETTGLKWVNSPIVYLATFPSTTVPGTGATDVAGSNILTTPTKTASGVTFSSGVLTIARALIAANDKIECDFVVERDTQTTADGDTKVVLRVGESMSLGGVYTHTSTTDGLIYNATLRTYFPDLTTQMSFTNVQNGGGSSISINSNTSPFKSGIDLTANDWKIELRGYVNARVDDGIIFKGGFCRLFKQTW